MGGYMYMYMYGPWDLISKVHTGQNCARWLCKTHDHMTSIEDMCTRMASVMTTSYHKSIHVCVLHYDIKGMSYQSVIHMYIMISK